MESEATQYNRQKAREAERVRRVQSFERKLQVMDSDQLAEIVRQLPDLEGSGRLDPTNRQVSDDVEKEAESFQRSLNGHDTASVTPPYESLQPTVSHIGNPPELQRAVANTDGLLEIFTSINRESSNTHSIAEYQVRLLPHYGPSSSISFRPYVTYWAQRYLSAAGPGESHSAAFVRSAVFSAYPDGSDWRPEASSRGVQLWSDRAQNFLGVEFGHKLDSSEPDFEGTVWPPDLEVNLDGSVHPQRIYFGRVWVDSNSDADGSHLTIASHASVYLQANVRWIFIEQSGSVLPSRKVRVSSRHSGKVLDVKDFSVDNSAPIIQFDWHGGNNQRWRVEEVGNGLCRIVSVHSGKVLDVLNASLDNLAPIIQFDWHGGNNQRWRVEDVGDGFSRIVSAHSGKVLDVKDFSVDNSAPIIQFDWHGGNNQRWLVEPPPLRVVVTIPGFHPHA